MSVDDPTVREQLGWGCLSVALAWQVAGCGQPETPVTEARLPASPQPPDVVLVIGCTVRKELLGPYGSAPEQTSFLSELARRGVVFDDLIANAPWTKPAHTALLTGRFPDDIGMIEPGDGLNTRRLSPVVATMAEHFQAAGYATIGGTANPNLNTVFGWGQGFSDYHEAAQLWRVLPITKRKVPGDALVEVALQSAAAVSTEQPLYLQLTLVDTHQPLTTSPEAGQALAEEHDSLLVGQYRGDMRSLDTALRRLQDGLEAMGRDPAHTLFVFTADHGEGLQWPDPDAKGHGPFLAPSVVQVPWIVAGPGVPAGRRVAGLASQVDVLPTVLALAGLTAPSVDGLDWSAQVRAAPATLPRQRAFTSTQFKQHERVGVFARAVACEEAPRSEETRCWDRRTDPFGLSNIDPDESLLAELRAWRAARSAAYEAWPDTADADLERHIEEQLAALGYLDSPGEDGLPDGQGGDAVAAP